MAFHKSNLGCFGENLPCDMDGYVPEAEDTIDMFTVDLVGEDQQEWWKEDDFEEWRNAAVAKTAEALTALAKWQKQNI